MVKRILYFFQSIEWRIRHSGELHNQNKMKPQTKEKKRKRLIESFLFFTPSFLSGAGSVVNLAGASHRLNSYDFGFETDRAAIENDFRMIGQDISDAFEEISEDEKSLF